MRSGEQTWFQNRKCWSSTTLRSAPQIKAQTSHSREPASQVRPRINEAAPPLPLLLRVGVSIKLKLAPGTLGTVPPVRASVAVPARAGRARQANKIKQRIGVQIAVVNVTSVAPLNYVA